MSSLTLTMLHTVYGGPAACKRMARDASVSHRTAEKWWAAMTTPRADVLLRMARENALLRSELVRLLGDLHETMADLAAREMSAVAGTAAGGEGEGAVCEGRSDRGPVSADD